MLHDAKPSDILLLNAHTRLSFFPCSHKQKKHHPELPLHLLLHELNKRIHIFLLRCNLMGKCYVVVTVKMMLLNGDLFMSQIKWLTIMMMCRKKSHEDYLLIRLRIYAWVCVVAVRTAFNMKSHQMFHIESIHLHVCVLYLIFGIFLFKFVQNSKG